MKRSGNIMNFAAGGLMILFALAFGAMSLGYGLGTPGRMNPGFFPFFCSVVLAFLGLAMVLLARQEAPEAIRIDWRPFVFISLATVVFAALIDVLGFVAATFCAVTITSLSEPERTVLSTVIVATFLSVLLWLIFVFGLGLQVSTFAWNIPWI